MKVKVYLNRVKTDWQTDFNKAQDYFKRKGVEIDFTFETYDYKDLSFIEVNLYPQGRRVFVQPYMANVLPVDKSYDFTIFVFNQEEFPVTGMPQGLCYEHLNGIYIDVGTHRNNPADLTYVEICHELMHGLVKKARKAGFKVDDLMDSYYNNFFLESEDSNFGQQWKLLKPYIHSLKVTQGYKYFSQKEVDTHKLKPELWRKLDIIREECKFPISITSGLRSKEQNDALKDSVSDSSHLSGLACDIACSDSIKRFKLVQEALKNGIYRIGIGKDFVHLDIDNSKVKNVCWTYYK